MQTSGGSFGPAEDKPVWRRALTTAGDFLSWWPMRYLVGPGLLASSQFQTETPSQYGAAAAGLLLVEGSTVVTARRVKRARDLEEHERLRANKKEAQLRVTELLIDLVTALEMTLAPNDSNGRFRGAIYLEEPAAPGSLRIAYMTTGFSADEQGLTWQRDQGAVGCAWVTNKVTIAPCEGRADILRDWGMTPVQQSVTSEVEMVVAKPLALREEPSKTVAVLVIDDTTPPGEYLDSVRLVTETFTQRFAELLAVTGLEIPS